MSAPETPSVPPGFRVRLADDVAVLGDNAVLVGGSPLTSMRLKGAARGRLENRSVTVTDPISAHVADRLLSTNLGLPDLSEVQSARAAELTVVVPVRDRAQLLDRCLAALAGLSCIVVDDASRHPDAVAAVARRHGAALVPLTRNVGPAAARNAGLARVRTPYVAFVDSDVQVDGSDLLRLARHFADPAVVLVGPRVLGHTEGGRPNWYERYENRDSSLTLGTRAGIVRPGAAVAWLPSACLVARTGSLGAGFDGALRVGEDVDLVWRLGEAGHRIRYDPAVEARHETRGSVHDWLARKAFYGKGSAVLAARHGDRVAPAVLSPPYALAAAAALTRHWVAVPLVLAALARGHRAVAQALPSAPGHERLAARIAARGFGWAARQEASLLLRHWWPAAAGAAIVSRSARRALLTALAVDLAVVVRETPGLPTRDLPAHFVARRLDDLAYGAGLWSGAVRGRCVTPLRPRWTGRPRIR